MLTRNKRTKRTAQNLAAQEKSKRLSVLAPSAREIFAVRFRTTELRPRRHGGHITVVVTQPWPDGYTRAELLARVNASGIR